MPKLQKSLFQKNMQLGQCCVDPSICIYITYLSDTKISSTEVTLIFAIVPNFSDFPLHSMQKCIKTVVLLDRPPFVPSAGDIVFLVPFSKVM